MSNISYSIWVNGKPGAKYPDHHEASIELKKLRAKFPDDKIELKRTSNMSATIEGKRHGNKLV